ncbi:MAG: MFS transporter [Actinobacteria bacterium]|nr:MFS transporter [Actinomycetota bacterium]
MLANDLPDSALAGVTVAAAAVVIFLGPWVGARTDARGTRLPALVATTIAAVAATFFLATGPIWLTAGLLWVAVIGVNTGSVVYDALLVDVSTPENRGWISGVGVGVGYLGSLIGLGIGLVAIDVLGWGHAGTFRSLAIGFLVFAIPAFFFIVEPRRRPESPPGLGVVVARMFASWRLAARHQGVVPFLIGRFFYTDAVNTLLGGFLAVFVLDELGLSRGFLSTLLGIAIGGAMVGGFLAGRLLYRVRPLWLLRISLLGWVLAIGLAILTDLSGVLGMAWLIGPLGGVAVGMTGTTDRVVMTRISPPRHLGELYGLYSTVGRFATIFGPLVWAVIVDGLGWGRNVAMGALGVFILAGWWILRSVDDMPRSWPLELQVPLSESQDEGRT